MALEIIAVAVPAPLFGTFDYLVPADLPEPLAPGMRVRVPFGRRQLIGVVVQAARRIEHAEFSYKPIAAVLDQAPLLPADLLETCGWAAAYYHHPLGEVLATALPAALRQARKLRAPRTPTRLRTAEPEPEPLLTAEQAQALTALREGEGFRVHLLEGITGSGKTELYLQRTAEVLAQGRQVLILVPEIGLAPQLMDRCQRRFGSGRVATYHSGMTEAERARAWLAVRDSSAQIVVGTRSAVLLPFAGLGLVVVDEEHDVSFKQQDGLRYHARDLAVVRAQMLGVPVILGSATPSIESLHNAATGRYRHVRLERRVHHGAAPAARLVDVRCALLRHGLSEVVLERMNWHLDNGGQVLLFVNRRGYAPALLCHDCGWTAACTHCDARLTLHRARRRLICHHCGSQASVPAACADCGGTALIPVGQGTERIEEALRSRFPEHRLERFDSDRMSKRGEWERLLSDVREGAVRILVGTQMLAKGHDFADLSLVAIVSADQALFGSDFRAVERMAQTVTQVGGRAGRASRPGEVLLQTHAPQHPVLQQLVNNGYRAVCETLMTERRQAGLPPFGHLALLRAEARDPAAPMQFLNEAAASLRREGVQLAGPAPAPMARRAGRVRAQLLLQAGRRSALHAALAPAIPALQDLPTARQVRWSLDIDPADLF